MPFGAQLSDVQHYYYEQFFAPTFNTQIAQGSNANFNLGSLTMPWTGDVICDGYVNMYYDQGATILAATVNQATSIAATNFWPGTKTETSPSYGWIVIPFFGRWANLSKATFFQLTVKVSVGAVNGRAVVSTFAGSIRAQAA